jgi:hypothetical protein
VDERDLPQADISRDTRHPLLMIGHRRLQAKPLVHPPSRKRVGDGHAMMPFDAGRHDPGAA